MKVLRFLRNVCLAALLVCLGLGGLLVWQGYQMYAQAVEQVPLQRRVEEQRAQEGYTQLEELPVLYREAVVAVEDHRFYQHGGIDLLAIGRALWNDLLAMSFVEGGSTITQQLAKNLYFTQEKELTRKVAEVFLAWDLEKAYTKDEILELYVNSIYFGGGCYNVRDASLAYFDKEPSQMTDKECTLLAGIPNAPSVYDLNVNPDLAAQRQRQVVANLVEREYLTDSEAAALLG